MEEPLDALVSIPRSAVSAVMHLRSTVPAGHPSAEILGEERMGTGVAVGAHRVLTAHFLVVGAEKVEVVGFDGQKYAVRKMHVDHETGLALLALDGPSLSPASLGTGDESTPGLPVFLLASVDASERKGATGHVTKVGPFETYWEYMLDRAILTTIVNPGLAGAPLFAADGCVIGLVALGLASVGRYSAAIPIDLYWRYREEMEGLVARRPPRGWLGLYAQPFDGGVIVTGVVSDGPAEEAGLKRGDVILTVDGQEIGSLRCLYGSIQRRNPGDEVGLQVLRDSSIIPIGVRAADRNVFFA